jgi:hypothetical protein
LLEQPEEEGALGAELTVNRALRETSRLGNVVQRRQFNPALCENPQPRLK